VKNVTENRSQSSITTRTGKKSLHKKYEIGMKVIVQWYSSYYVAKIVRTPVENDEMYLLHFMGWNRRWDAWFDVNKILEYNETNLETMKIAQAQAIKEKLNKMSFQNALAKETEFPGPLLLKEKEENALKEKLDQDPETSESPSKSPKAISKKKKHKYEIGAKVIIQW